MAKNYIGFVAAGTGGHINAAKALGDYFSKCGYDPIYISGQRILDKRLFANCGAHFLPSKSIRNRSLFAKIGSLFFNFITWLKAIDVFTQYRPQAVIGAGGYICGPTLLAAWFLGIPIYILEQNSIAGLTNRLLSIFANKVFTNFKQTKGLAFVKYKTVVTGNPVSHSIVAGDFSAVCSNEKIKILVVGGSLGAQEINSVVEKFITSNKANGIIVRHQTGINKGFSATAVQCDYQQLDYIDNMSEQYQWANLIICRAGASTLSELRYVQKPTVLIPYPYATDNHQMINANFFQQEELFPIYVHSGQELEDNNFALLEKIISHNEIDRQYMQKDLSSKLTAQAIIYKECLNDF